MGMMCWRMLFCLQCKPITNFNIKIPTSTLISFYILNLNVIIVWSETPFRGITFNFSLNSLLKFSIFVIFQQIKWRTFCSWWEENIFFWIGVASDMDSRQLTAQVEREGMNGTVLAAESNLHFSFTIPTIWQKPSSLWTWYILIFGLK